MATIGHDLGEHHLDRPHRHGEQVLHRAALALLGDRQRRHEQGRDHQHDADQPRHDVEHGELLGIVAGVHHETGTAGCAGSAAHHRRQVAVERGGDGRERRRGVADRRGIGGVGVDQHRRLSPRSTERSKSGGMLSTNSSSPSARPARPRPRRRACGCRNSRCSAAPRRGVRSYFECSTDSRPVGRCFGSVLIA